MSYTYDQRKRPQGPQSAPPEPARAPVPDLDALMTGAVRPTAAQKGRPIDLDGAMRATMEHAFGDLSAVKLYESRAVGDAGAEAIAQGNEIAFAPGMANFSTRSGQERLGHELSHVMSQRSGAVRGQGFLASTALEARADREGAMAAAGEQVYTGPVSHALSGASPSPMAAGPMQASRGKKGPREPENNPDVGPLKTNNAAINAALNKEYEDTTGLGNDAFSQFGKDRSDALNPMKIDYRPGMKDTMSRLLKKYKGDQYKNGSFMQSLSRPRREGEDSDVEITGLVPDRMLPYLMGDRGRGFDMSEDAIEGLMDKLMAPQKLNMTDKEKQSANQQFDEGVLQYKNILMDDMDALENTYGALPGQMHPHDVVPQMGPQYHKMINSTQDMDQMIKSGGKYFDFDHNQRESDFRNKVNYYRDVDNQLVTYKDYATETQLGLQGNPAVELPKSGAVVKEDTDFERSLNGPKMNQQQLTTYKKQLKKRAKKGGWKDWLFGRYK